MSATLYAHQERAVEQLREHIRNGIKNIVLCAPTGSGKTEIAAHLIERGVELRKRSMFVVDRISLLDQTSARFDKYDISHGVIQANHWRWRPWDRVQVASAQTLARREWPEALDMIVVDECHTIQKSTIKRIDKRDCVTIGLTATPFTKGLGKHYDALVNVVTTRELIEQGFLAPFRAFSPSEPDMEGAKVVAGEWTDEEVEARAMPIVGDCVEEYIKHGSGQKFIAFGATVRHCEEIQRCFAQAGIRAGLYTYRTNDDERKAMLKEFEQSDTTLRGLISVAALAKGFDREDIAVVIDCRPLRKSLTEHIQKIGRGLRRDPNNPNKVCTILDHAGNMMRFWAEMNEFFDKGATELDDGTKPDRKPRERQQAALKCPKCAHVHAPRPSCPYCGYEYPTRQMVHVAGQLVAMGGGATAPYEVRCNVLGQLRWLALKRGYKPGWVGYQYKNIFGVWPNGMEHVQPIEAGKEVKGLVRERQKEFAATAKAPRLGPVNGPHEPMEDWIDRNFPYDPQWGGGAR